MTISANTLVENLNEDLANEYQAMLFYLHSSMVLKDVCRLPIKQSLLENASRHEDRIKSFGAIITELGLIPSTKTNGFRGDLFLVNDIFSYAKQLEENIVLALANRKKQAESCNDLVVNAKLSVFVDKMLLQSVMMLSDVKKSISIN